MKLATHCILFSLINEKDRTLCYVYIQLFWNKACKNESMVRRNPHMIIKNTDKDGTYFSNVTMRVTYWYIK